MKMIQVVGFRDLGGTKIQKHNQAKTDEIVRCKGACPGRAIDCNKYTHALEKTFENHSNRNVETTSRMRGESA